MEKLKKLKEFFKTQKGKQMILGMVSATVALGLITIVLLILGNKTQIPNQEKQNAENLSYPVIHVSNVVTETQKSPSYPVYIPQNRAPESYVYHEQPRYLTFNMYTKPNDSWIYYVQKDGGVDIKFRVHQANMSGIECNVVVKGQDTGIEFTDSWIQYNTDYDFIFKLPEDYYQGDLYCNMGGAEFNKIVRFTVQETEDVNIPASYTS